MIDNGLRWLTVTGGGWRWLTVTQTVTQTVTRTVTRTVTHTVTQTVTDDDRWQLVEILVLDNFLITLK